MRRAVDDRTARASQVQLHRARAALPPQREPQRTEFPPIKDAHECEPLDCAVARRHDCASRYRFHEGRSPKRSAAQDRHPSPAAPTEWERAAHAWSGRGAPIARASSTRAAHAFDRSGRTSDRSRKRSPTEFVPIRTADALSTPREARSTRKRAAGDAAKPRRPRKSAAASADEGDKPARRRSARKSRSKTVNE